MVTFQKGAWFEGDHSWSTYLESGSIVIGDGYLRLGPDRVLQLTEIGWVTFERIPILGKVVLVDRHPQKLVLFITRLNIGGRCVVIDGHATAALGRELQSRVTSAIRAFSD